MLKTITFGVRFFMVAQVLSTALDLQCYECTGPKGQAHDCESNIGNVNVQNCTPGFVCTLFVSTGGNQSTIHRLCSESNECDVVRAKNSHTLGNVTIDVCTTCTSNYCNSAKSYVSKFTLISFLISSLSIFSISLVFNKFLI